MEALCTRHHPRIAYQVSTLFGNTYTVDATGIVLNIAAIVDRESPPDKRYRRHYLIRGWSNRLGNIRLSTYTGGM